MMKVGRVRHGLQALLCNRHPRRTYVNEKKNDFLPGVRKIILIRHGESLGNVDEYTYGTTADWRIPLTNNGRNQARQAGEKIASLLHACPKSGSDSVMPGKVYFYVSPYLRTRQTLREILREIDTDCIVGIREDPRIAEQQFGNFQTHHAIQDNKIERVEFGRFFYRFPNGGESGFDVYNRVSGFIGTMARDSSDIWESHHDDVDNNGSNNAIDDMTICIVTHGLTMRLFLMRWFQYSVHEFERSFNPENGRVVILNLMKSGRFDLCEMDRQAIGFPPYHDQERFRLMNDFSLLDINNW